MALNRDGAGMLAAAAARRGTPIIHLSTDYVFDGAKASAYSRRRDRPHVRLWPHEARRRARGSNRQPEAHHHAHGLGLQSVGQNFVKTMLAHAAKGTDLKVVSDQIGSPPTLRILWKRSSTWRARSWPRKAKASRGACIMRRALALPHGMNSRARSSINRRLSAGQRRRFPPLARTVIPRAPSAPRTRASTARSSPRFGVTQPDWREGVRLLCGTPSQG